MHWVLTAGTWAPDSVAFFWNVAWHIESSPDFLLEYAPSANFDVCVGRTCPPHMLSDGKSIRFGRFKQHISKKNATAGVYPTTVALSNFTEMFDPRKWVLKCPSLHRGQGVSLSLKHTIWCPGRWWVQRRIYSQPKGVFTSGTTRFYAAIYNDAVGVTRAFMDVRYALQLWSSNFRTNIAITAAHHSQNVLTCQNKSNGALCSQAATFLTHYVRTLMPIVASKSMLQVVAVDTVTDATGRLFVLEVNIPGRSCRGMSFETCKQSIVQLSSLLCMLRGGKRVPRWKELQI